jgi:hypothetical protein
MDSAWIRNFLFFLVSHAIRFSMVRSCPLHRYRLINDLLN